MCNIMGDFHFDIIEFPSGKERFKKKFMRKFNYF